MKIYYIALDRVPKFSRYRGLGVPKLCFNCPRVIFRPCWMFTSAVLEVSFGLAWPKLGYGSTVLQVCFDCARDMLWLSPTMFGYAYTVCEVCLIYARGMFNSVWPILRMFRCIFRLYTRFVSTVLDQHWDVVTVL